MPEAKRRSTERQPSAPAQVIPIDAGGRRERVLALRNELIERHRPMVESIARSFLPSCPPSITLDDLISAGSLALTLAASRYVVPVGPGATFGVYARQRVRGAMLDLVVDKPSGSRESKHESLGEAHDVAPSNVTEITRDRGRLPPKVAWAFQQLPARSRRLLAAYYGPDEPSLADIAREMKVCPQRAAKIHSEAIDTMRDLLRVAR